MSGFLTVDPGKKYLGWAWWECGELWACGLSKAKGRYARDCVLEHLENLAHYLPCRVVAEEMQWDGRSHGKGAQLLELQLISGRLGTEWVTPREWKGTVSRETEQNRTAAKLTNRELQLLAPFKRDSTTGHNVWSAVGIGCHVLKRRLLFSVP